MPTTFDGSLRGGVVVPAHDGLPERGTPDPDDFSCGFAVWNGSSFSAPACAGAVAHVLCGTEATTDVGARSELAAKALRTVLGGEP